MKELLYQYATNKKWPLKRLHDSKLKTTIEKRLAEIN